MPARPAGAARAHDAVPMLPAVHGRLSARGPGDAGDRVSWDGLEDLHRDPDAADRAERAEAFADRLMGTRRPKGAVCGGVAAALPLHTCPFKSEINDDTTTLCKCCDDCRSECAADV